MRRTLILLILLALASSLSADDVFLRNGRVFKDVGTAVDGSHVTIFLPFGEIGFSSAAVERIEKAEPSYSLYVRRRDVLRADVNVSAADWIELARWSRSRELEHGAREAAMIAARLDPQAAGLPVLMAQFGYTFSAELGRWLPFEESMGLRGYEFVEGRWMSAEQRQAQALELAAAGQAREAAESRRLTNAVLALAAAQLTREVERPQTGGYGLPLYYGYYGSGYYGSGYYDSGYAGSAPDGRHPSGPGSHRPQQPSHPGGDRPANLPSVGRNGGVSHRGGFGGTSSGGAVSASSQGHR